MVGSLMFAALGSRPDIAFSVTDLSWYNVQPLEMHATAAKRVLRYMKTTAGFRINNRRLLNPFTIVRYTDSDWVGNLTTRKSVSGCVFGLGNTNVNNELLIFGLIHWQAKSQSVVAVKVVDGPVPIGCNNQGAIKLITSGVVRQKSKHIDAKYHHVHDEQDERRS